MTFARRSALLGLLGVSFATGAKAQATVSGVIRDSVGRPIGGAEVSIAALNKAAISDGAGRYSIDGVTPGLRLVQVRRLGFAAQSRMLRISDSTTADFVLALVVVKLDTVRTTEEYKPTDILMMEFLDNKKLGLGKFLTRDDLEKMNDRRIAEAFMQLPGIVVITPNLSSGAAWLASSITRSFNVKEVQLEDLQCLKTDPRRAGSCMLYEDTAPFKQAWKSRCFPDIYLDFDLLSRREVPNISRFSTAQLEAVEVYANAAQLPPRYIGSTSPCGAVIFHARRHK